MFDDWSTQALGVVLRLTDIKGEPEQGFLPAGSAEGGAACLRLTRAAIARALASEDSNLQKRSKPAELERSRNGE